MAFLNGIAASNGIAIAKAYRLVEPNLTFDKKSVDDVTAEVERFRQAIS
ncbi:phosphoenolpyruvate-utilizing N-terminal domain-containing protein, partial [Bacillus sp. JJ1764]